MYEGLSMQLTYIMKDERTGVHHPSKVREIYLLFGESVVQVATTNTEQSGDQSSSLGRSARLE